MLYHTDSISSFSVTLDNKNKWISKQDLYSLYGEYVKLNGGVKETIETFGGKIKKDLFKSMKQKD